MPKEIQKFQATAEEIAKAIAVGCPSDPSWSMNESAVEDLREFLNFDSDLVNILFVPDTIETHWGSDGMFNLIGEITFIFRDNEERHTKLSYEGWHVPLDIDDNDLAWPRRLPGGKRKVVVKEIYQDREDTNPIHGLYTVVSVPFPLGSKSESMRRGITPYTGKDHCPVWTALSSKLEEEDRTSSEEKILRIHWQELNF